MPSVDAAAVSALKSAGAIVTCKTTTCKSGYKLTADSPVSGITRNPWNRDRTSGGSSGGAAASIAAGCGPLAIGTDGVGSIRVPSVVLRRGWYQADLRIGPEIARLFATVMGVAGAYRADRAHGRRRRPASGSDRGPRSARCRQSAVPARRFDATPVKLDGIRIGSSADFGYAAVAPMFARHFSRRSKCSVRLGADIVPDCVQFEPDMLERILKPIAYTEQAAAVSARGAERSMAPTATIAMLWRKALPTAVSSICRGRLSA